MPENHAVEVDRLRNLTRDLVAISTLPAIWGSLNPEGVVKSLSNVLLSTLNLDFVYIRLANRDGSDTIENLCSKRHGASEGFLPQVRVALDAFVMRFDADAPATIPDPFDDGTLRVSVTRFGIAEDNGIVVVGARRADFPSEHDRLLLGVGANQAASTVRRQRTEQALQRSEGRFLDFANAAPAMLWVTEPSGSCSFLSRGWYEFTGQHQNDGIDFGWITAIHPEDQERVGNAFQGANENREEFTLEYRLLHANGSYRWVIDQGRPRLSSAGGFLGFVGSVLDITNRKQAEEALSETQAQLSAIFEILPVGVGVVNADGIVVLSNQEMQRYLPTRIQPSLDDARHSRWRAYWEDGRPYCRQDFPGVRALQGERVVPGIEMLYTQDDGAEIWTQVAAVPIRGDSGHITGQVAVVTDIDAFKRTEAALRVSEEKYRSLFNEMAQSNKHLSDFLAVLAHELRNPLAPILTGVEMMRIRPDSPETVVRVRDMIERQATQMVHLINDLLDIARVTNGKIEIKKKPIDLNSIISSAIETSLPVIEAARHELSVRLSEKPLRLNADPTRIAQIVGNLLTNAAKYTSQGGKIKLIVDQDGAEAVISVIDNGIGIPSDSLSQVFEMFSQVGRNMDHSQGGLGIGLGLVRNLVHLHGGTVTATSEGTGKGSTFIVRLPIDHVDKQHYDAYMSSTPTGITGTTLRILVADDNLDAAQSLASLLDMYGHDVQVAKEGTQALQVANDFQPDVAFLDIGMPGMNGYEVAIRIRKMTGLEGITLVAVTGWGTDEDRARSTAAGFNKHFTKPLSPTAVSELLEEIGHWR
ncbi:PAS domain-containing hybrid sensor histidine kinase/response regulator [Noviherbaspirillum aerium]|uniref:PAS domain-containing hybrid sensor histidine kinase/response regulator n=1 Tax=Noviherbaspirillum aerium TaxID=2588497 RepID=UPI00178C17C5|nr:ATP-binding protein [Noviherbaspirillum aerium]